MSNIPDEHEIFGKLKNIIVSALMVDSDLVTQEAKIFNDLDAESIDIVDMRFQIEQTFGLKIDQNEMLKSLGENLDAYEVREKFTVGWVARYISDKLKSVVQS